MKDMLKQKWMIPVATMVLTLSIGSAAFAATGSASTDTTAAATTDTAIVSTVTTAADTASTTATSAATDATASTTAKQAPDSSKPWGNQRSDETLVTGDALAQLTAAAQAKVSGGTVVRVETDADGNGKYEVHMTKADGTLTTVYFDASYNFVSVIDGGGGGNHAQDKGHAGTAPAAASAASRSTATTAASSSGVSN